MRKTLLLAFLGLLTLPFRAPAQDAHSQAIGYAATSAQMGIFSILWNPSVLMMPEGTAWSVGSGFTAYDTSNSGAPILHFTPDNGRGSSTDPILRSQEYEGVFSVRNVNMAGGVFYDQSLAYSGSQGTLEFLNDRAQGTLSSNPYALALDQTTQQVATLILSYASPLPFGSAQLFSIGGSLKYHDGLQFEEDSLSGTYTQGVTTGYSYTKTTSNAGSGLSVDLGLFAKLSDALEAGLMLENIQSSFTWTAQQTTFQLDPTTGAESKVGNPVALDVSRPFPYTTKLGLTMAPPDKNISLEGEVAWSQGQTRWRGGVERYYPEANLAVRLGTFADPTSNQQMWTFGVGYIQKFFNVDASFVTRSIPDLQNSIALGGGIDAAVRF